jgi:hypothetical protein
MRSHCDHRPPPVAGARAGADALARNAVGAGITMKTFAVIVGQRELMAQRKIDLGGSAGLSLGPAMPAGSVIATC